MKLKFLFWLMVSLLNCSNIQCKTKTNSQTIYQIDNCEWH